MVSKKNAYKKANRFNNWAAKWKDEFIKHWPLIVLSILFLILANIVSVLASNYVDKITTIAVPDLILDHIPTLDLDGIFIYGFLGTIGLLLIYVIIFKIDEFHRVANQFSILVLVRSFFITLTHLGKPAGAIILTNTPAAYQLFNFHNDLFFSGHTAIPFLAFLIFRKEKIGIFFLIMAFILAATVLFLHLHYSIDVFSAFFITYGVYIFSNWFSKKLEK